MATNRYAAQLENDMHLSAHNVGLGAGAAENGHWAIWCSVLRIP